MTDDRPAEPRRHRQDLGQMPGVNGSPYGASFRDGPATTPGDAPGWKTRVIGTAVVVIAIIVIAVVVT